MANELVRKFQGLYQYIRDVAKVQKPDCQVYMGRTESLFSLQEEFSETEFNVYILPFSKNGTIGESQKPDDVWNVGIFLFKQDRIDSDMDENNAQVFQDEMTLVDEAFNFADQLVRYMNFNQFNAELQNASETINIQSFSAEPSIKEFGNMMTGVLVSMVIEVPDNFQYCDLVPDAELEDVFEYDLEMDLIG